MSKYTAEQVIHAADLEQARYDGDLIISGYLRDYATLLRERESAKAAVTDDPRNEFPLLYDNLDALDERAAEQPNRIATARILVELRHQIGYVMTKLYGERAALEAVAPMLASARVPDETGWLIESAFNGFSPSWWGGVPEGCGQSFTANPNKAVRFCRKDDAEAVAKHMHMVIVTEHKWLAAAPKPETKE